MFNLLSSKVTTGVLRPPEAALHRQALLVDLVDVKQRRTLVRLVVMRGLAADKVALLHIVAA